MTNMVHLGNFYLWEKYLKVKAEQCGYRFTEAGTPQGGVLRPHRFAAYTGIPLEKETILAQH